MRCKNKQVKSKQNSWGILLININNNINNNTRVCNYDLYHYMEQYGRLLVYTVNETKRLKTTGKLRNYTVSVLLSNVKQSLNIIDKFHKHSTHSLSTDVLALPHVITPPPPPPLTPPPPPPPPPPPHTHTHTHWTKGPPFWHTPISNAWGLQFTISQRRFRWRLGAEQAANHYLN